jgi:hypothetical protein
MRKNILSLSIAAMIGGLGFAGAASAAVLTTGATALDLNVTSGGTGHILVVPYYTVQNGNVTLVNLVNSDSSNGKEVKIRFRGASNSDDVFDFTLYMSPSDMWSFKVTQDNNGLANLVTYDASCTTLKLAVAGSGAGTNYAFPTSRLPASFTTAQKNAETREGYIEILNTANIPSALQPGQSNVGGTVSTNPLFTAVKHVAGVAPCTTSTLTALASIDFNRAVSATAAGTAASVAGGSLAGEKAASTSGLTNPTGGLFANSTVLNLNSTLTFTQEATAITAVTAAGGSIAGAANIIHSPQLGTSVAAAGNTFAGADGAGNVFVATAVVNAATADPLLRTANIARAGYVNLAAAQVTPLFQDLPDLSTPYVSLAVNGTAGAAAAALSSPLSQAINLTKSLAAKSVMNEYQTVASIGGATDWTFSMPTRRYSVAMDYTWVTAKGGTDGRIFTDLDAVTGGSAATNLAAASTARYFSIDNTSVSGQQICVAGDATNGIATFDREEGTSSTPITISPSTTTVPAFCGEVSVVSFNVGNVTGASVLGSSIARQDFPMIGVEGWSRISTLGLANVAVPAVPAASAEYNGLPVVGASYMKATGATSNYGLIANHRYAR